MKKKVEKYEREIEWFEVMKYEWNVEKKMLEKILYDLKGKMREKEEKINIVNEKKGLMEVKKK